MTYTIDYADEKLGFIAKSRPKTGRFGRVVEISHNTILYDIEYFSAVDTIYTSENISIQ
jgi:hypothetical protein